MGEHEALSLVEVHGSHDGDPNHGNCLMLSHAILFDSLFQVSNDLLDRLLIIDRGFQTSLNIFFGPCILHSCKISDNLLLVRGDENVLDVLGSSLIGWKQLIKIVVQARLLQQAEHRSGTLLSLDQLFPTNKRTA